MSGSRLRKGFEKFGLYGVLLLVLAGFVFGTSTVRDSGWFTGGASISTEGGNVDLGGGNFDAGGGNMSNVSQLFSNIAYIDNYLAIMPNATNPTGYGSLNLFVSENEGGSSIVFYDDIFTTDTSRRLGQISYHGNNTGVNNDEIAFYTTDSSGVMQNRFKLDAQTDNSPIILTGSDGIVRTSGNPISIGQGYDGSDASDTNIHGHLKIRKSITDDGTLNYINFSVENIYLQSDMTGGDSTIYFYDATGGTFRKIQFDKFNFPGVGNNGFYLDYNTYIDGEFGASGISEDGTGKAVCIKADKTLGTCSDAVNSTGGCTCG